MKMADVIRNVAVLNVHNRNYANDLQIDVDRRKTKSNIDDVEAMFANDDECVLSNTLKKVPAENSWFHGRLDRLAAEERLSGNSEGSYLIRESERKPGSYVLSYLGKTGINHFRITAVCGDFYIGGRKFNSLADLIAYYTFSSDLLKKERLISPIPPPEPVNDNKKVIAILPYTKMPETDELSFKKGDIFYVHNDLGSGWIWVTAHRSGEQGIIFKELVEDLDESVDPNVVFPWFHLDISKDEAVDLLIKAGPGSFLVRPSDNSPGDYSLFFHINNQIQRFRIEKRGVRYLMGGRTFECLDAVISRYKVEQIVEGHTLTLPVKKLNQDCIYMAKEISHAEKIYATLNECREMSGLKESKGMKMHGWMEKCSEKVRKWKSLYFELYVYEADVLLYSFDNPKRTKPRGFIDLACSYLYPVHESLFDKQGCFQLVERALPCMGTVTYLCVTSPTEFENWLDALKSFCATRMSFQPKHPSVREVRNLTVSVLEAHNLPTKWVPTPFCLVQLNQVKVARTRAETGSHPDWDEEFILHDIPPDVSTITVTILNQGRRSKDTEVAEVVIDLQDLQNGKIIEEWYSLMGITPVGGWGMLRLRLLYLYDLVMPLEEYSALKELLLDAQLEVVRTLADLCYKNRGPLEEALLPIFRYEKKEAVLLQTLNDLEISKEEETSTLFRAASLATRLMDLYMRSVCQNFLRYTIGDIIQRILESRQSCELNPNKVDSTVACANAEFLLQVLDQVSESIFSSCNHCPLTLRYLLGCLQATVSAKWPHERFVRTRVVSGFIFLRLLCPALLNPRQFRLVIDPPPPQAMRSLVMIAKCLQNLANLIEFGGKESYMEVVNPFILKNKERMIVFLDQLSNVKEKPEIEDLPWKGDIAKDLGTVHDICVTHLSELQALSRLKLTIRKLVTVTDMLTKHKLKYFELLR